MIYAELPFTTLRETGKTTGLGEELLQQRDFQVTKKKPFYKENIIELELEHCMYYFNKLYMYSAVFYARMSQSYKPSFS